MYVYFKAGCQFKTRSNFGYDLLKPYFGHDMRTESQLRLGYFFGHRQIQTAILCCYPAVPNRVMSLLACLSKLKPISSVDSLVAKDDYEGGWFEGVR
jgi:hypothetical protein